MTNTVDKLSLTELQKKYGGKFVILNKEETKVIVAEKKASKALSTLKERNISKSDVVFVGFVSEEGTFRL